MPKAEVINNFIKKIGYLQPNDIDNIKKAIEIIEIAHKDQYRLSGKPYIGHPLRAAEIISEIRLDSDSVVAALLHDTAEDTQLNINEIKRIFGPSVGAIVDGVTKLKKIKPHRNWFMPFKKNNKNLEQYNIQIESLRKMFIAMSHDIRVVLIKMADRISNLETLEYLPKNKQSNIAKESIELYAPIADRLGIGEFKGQLEDLSFPYVLHQEYSKVTKMAIPEIGVRKKYLNRLTKKTYILLEQNGINSKIYSRAKRWYSLYKKLIRFDFDLSKIYDLVAVRIIVPTVQDCYNALGIIHSKWKPLPGRIKDYIALPKTNGYQSIHTTVFADNNIVTEFQIRTPEMHRQAEFGIAAHWHYNEVGSSRTIPKKSLRWVKELVRWQKRNKPSSDISKSLKIDFFKDRIFAMTPNGDIKDLPIGATPVDFAYCIHTAIGNQCIGAKVNGKIVNLSHVLQNGDIVEIIKGKRNKPSPDWIKFVKTEHAKESIRKFNNLK